MSRNYQDYLGKTFGDMTITDVILKKKSSGIGNESFFNLHCNVCNTTRCVHAAGVVDGLGHKHGVPCLKANSHYYDYLIGTTIDDLMVLSIEYINTRFMAKCKCRICGREKIIRISHLENREGTKHRYCNRALYPLRFVHIFKGITQRCFEAHLNEYKHYGARGITCTWSRPG